MHTQKDEGGMNWLVDVDMKERIMFAKCQIRLYGGNTQLIFRLFPVWFFLNKVVCRNYFHIF
jgi:hypothetical protein